MGFIIVILVATVLILLHQRSKSLGKTSFLSRLFEPMPIKSAHYEEKLSRKKLLSNRALKKLRQNIVDEGKYRKSFLAAPTQENKHPFTVKLIWDRTQLSYVKLLIWNLHDGILITSQVHLREVRILNETGGHETFVDLDERDFTVDVRCDSLPSREARVVRNESDTEYSITLPSSEVEVFMQVIDYMLENDDDEMDEHIVAQIDEFLSETLKR